MTGMDALKSRTTSVQLLRTDNAEPTEDTATREVARTNENHTLLESSFPCILLLGCFYATSMCAPNKVRKGNALSCANRNSADGIISCANHS